MKYGKNHYTENYKTLLREIKENVNKWRNIPCSWIRLSIGKISLKLIYRLKLILIFISVSFYVIGIDKHYKIHMTKQRI